MIISLHKTADQLYHLMFTPYKYLKLGYQFIQFFNINFLLILVKFNLSLSHHSLEINLLITKALFILNIIHFIFIIYMKNLKNHLHSYVYQKFKTELNEYEQYK